MIDRQETAEPGSGGLPGYDTLSAHLLKLQNKEHETKNITKKNKTIKKKKKNA